MCDSTLTFGQRGSHFFQCPSKREDTRIPKKLARFISSGQLKQVYHVTLGFEESFLLTWRDTTGKDRIDASGLPPELIEFLYNRNRDVPNIRCTLGPYNASFFVHDKTSYLWNNLPEPLVAALKNNIRDGNWTDRPRLVALGAGDNFLLVTEKNAAVWDLRHYKSVLTLIRQKTAADIQNFVLHPYRYQCFISQSKGGRLFSENVPPHQAVGVQEMTESILKDTEAGQKKFLSFEDSKKSASLPKRPLVLQQRAKLRREWSEHSHELSARAKGMKLSFSLSVSLGGLVKRMG
ncbi:hypothetical protein PTMSG1_05122 [Pyrenophora teres f. maculata]|nr:hypothetical protein PTMSG1_05122 [Pyrenophora teres f. maculata]